MSPPVFPSDDIDRIMDVMAVAFDPAFGEAWTRRQVSDALMVGNCRYGLLDARGAPPAEGVSAAGFFMARGVLDEAELLLLAVKPEARRRGIGNNLLELFQEDSHLHGATRLLLEMRDGNTAENLYRQFGFTPIGRRPQYYRGANGARTDALTFEKLLACV
ncbi:ribosomal-protein-alanine acetyltransferase [Croceicoccus estronivorus]|nr:ribosomal-protein-alanine acetyltransferase [Croceicoccus estronivorus]